jgi:RNA polymerase sigma factor (sigma-70 family)
MPTDPPQAPEDLILAIARDRDRTAFTALFRHFGPKIETYAIRTGAGPAAAEELVQDVMLSVWLKAGTFNPTLASAATWIFRIARNRRIDRIRNESRPEPDPDDPAFMNPMPASPEEAAQVTQVERSLLAAMDSLSPEQTRALRLSYFEEKSHSEIAEEERIPLGTVKTRLRLALSHLKKRMKESA